MIAKLYYNIKFWYKLKFNRPIYRVDILWAVKYNYRGLRRGGICTSITKICHVCLNENYSIRWMDCINVEKLFPKLSRSNTLDFHVDDDGGYWWKVNDWKGGRMQFLDWLVDEYRDDKENLRNIKVYHL